MKSSEKSSKVFFVLTMCYMSFSAAGNVVGGREVFNVMMAGAAGDGRTDDGEVSVLRCGCQVSRTRRHERCRLTFFHDESSRQVLALGMIVFEGTKVVMLTIQFLV